MESMHILNGVTALLCAVVLGAIVMHPSIHEGVVLKAGMVMMIFSLGATAAHSFGDSENWRALWNASFILRLGLFVVAVGFVLRRHKLGSWNAAVSDWGDLCPRDKDR